MSMQPFKSQRVTREHADGVQCMTSYCVNGARNAVEVGTVVMFWCDECVERLRGATKNLTREIHNERESDNTSRRRARP